MIRSISPVNPVVMDVVTDPKEIAEFRARWEQADRNINWLKAHAQDVYSQNRGKFICIAGQELFVADTVESVMAMAEAAHPEDQGRYLRYIPRENLARIYANPR